MTLRCLLQVLATAREAQANQQGLQMPHIPTLEPGMAGDIITLRIGVLPFFGVRIEGVGRASDCMSLSSSRWHPVRCTSCAVQEAETSCWAVVVNVNSADPGMELP